LGRYQSIRLVKVDKTETVVLDKEKTGKSSIETEQFQNKTIAQIEDESNEISNDVEVKPDIQVDQKQIQQNTSDIEDLEPDPEDEEESKLIVEQAIRAEKQAKTSHIFAAIGLITLLIPYLGFIPLIIGLIFHLSANSSRYITPFGETRLKSSRILLIIDTVFLLLWILLVIGLIFIF
jgi:hypothetical protein